LRNGKFIKTGKISETTPHEVTTLMVGREVSDKEIYSERGRAASQQRETVLELENCSGAGFYDISFKVRKGEIIGLTGLAGSGASNLMQAMFGVTQFSSGSMKVFGKKLTFLDIHKAMKTGRIGMVPTNRKENSILPDMQLLENEYISEHTLSAWPFHIFRKKEMSKYNNYKKILNIKDNTCHDLITSLSGGNQQKIILARLLNTNADIFLLDNPTQGIDVGAKGEIYKLILQLSEQGKTILVNTLEIPEIEKVADQCVVFYHGRVHTILDRNKIDETTVMLHATGAVPPATAMSAVAGA
jgi:ribose transport system ATP-binding protein